MNTITKEMEFIAPRATARPTLFPLRVKRPAPETAANPGHFAGQQMAGVKKSFQD